MNKVLERLDTKLKAIYDNDKRHREEASDRVYMACERSGVDVDNLLDCIEDGTAFDLASFRSTSQGNIFDFVRPDLLEAVKYFPDITAGGNGGMASIGRGEFAIAFLSNCSSKMITEGKGDLKHSDGTYEELKFNGGKINVFDRAGKEIYSEFKKNLNGIVLKKKNYLPFRKQEQKLYTQLELEELNGLYGGVVLGQKLGAVSNIKLKELFLNQAMANVFQKVQSLLVMDEDGSYVRFKNAVDGENYYKNLPKGLLNLDFELRADQPNPVSIYLHTQHHKEYQ